jgi:hypothetical protein
MRWQAKARISYLGRKPPQILNRWLFVAACKILFGIIVLASLSVEREVRDAGTEWYLDLYTLSLLFFGFEGSGGDVNLNLGFWSDVDMAGMVFCALGNELTCDSSHISKQGLL